MRKLRETDFHDHLVGRMRQRGVTREEIQRTLDEGWNACDAKAGTLGKVMVFVFDREWEGRHYREKEVTVYYKVVGNDLVVLPAKARYGDVFDQGANK